MMMLVHALHSHDSRSALVSNYTVGSSLLLPLQLNPLVARRWAPRCCYPLALRSRPSPAGWRRRSWDSRGNCPSRPESRRRRRLRKPSPRPSQTEGRLSPYRNPHLNRTRLPIHCSGSSSLLSTSSASLLTSSCLRQYAAHRMVRARTKNRALALVSLPIVAPALARALTLAVRRRAVHATIQGGERCIARWMVPMIGKGKK